MVLNNARSIFFASRHSYIRPIPKGYKRHAGDACEAQSLRPLTTVERSYLQTFPKDFIFSGGKTDLEQMIGNAVPVNLAKYVALALKEYMEDFHSSKTEDISSTKKYPESFRKHQLTLFKAEPALYEVES